MPPAKDRYTGDPAAGPQPQSPRASGTSGRLSGEDASSRLDGLWLLGLHRQDRLPTAARGTGRLLQLGSTDADFVSIGAKQHQRLLWLPDARSPMSDEAVVLVACRLRRQHSEVKRAADPTPADVVGDSATITPTFVLVHQHMMQAKASNDTYPRPSLSRLVPCPTPISSGRS